MKRLRNTGTCDVVLLTGHVVPAGGCVEIGEQPWAACAAMVRATPEIEVEDAEGAHEGFHGVAGGGPVDRASGKPAARKRKPAEQG